MEQFISEHTGEEIDELIGQIPLKQDLPYITEFDWNSLSYVASSGKGEIILSKEFFEAAKARKTIVVPLYRGTQTGIIVTYAYDTNTITFIAQHPDGTVLFRMGVPSDITGPVTVPATYMGWTQMQPKLVSGDNIKTINGESVIGFGNLNVGGAYVTEFLLTDLTQSSSVTVTRAFAEAVRSKKPILIPVGKTVDNALEYIVVTRASGNDPDSNTYIVLEFLYGSTQYLIILSSKEAPETVAAVRAGATSLKPDTSALVSSMVIGGQTLTPKSGVLTVPSSAIYSAISNDASQFSSPNANFQLGANTTTFFTVPITGGTFNFTIAESSSSKVIKPVVIFSVDSDNPISLRIEVNREAVEVKWKNGVSNSAIPKGTYIMSLIIFKEIEGAIHAFGEIDTYQ